MSELELRSVSAIVEKAKTPEELFGLLAGDKMLALKSQYNRLMGAIHPDHFADKPDLWKVANAAFIKATSLFNVAVDRIRAGVYGDASKILTPKINDPNPPPKDLTIDGVSYHLERLYAQGDLCDLYMCAYTPKPLPPKEDKGHDSVWDALMEPEEEEPKPVTGALFKVVRSASDNDLITNEARILSRLYPPNQVEQKYFRYLPRFYATTHFMGGAGGRRVVNILARYDGMFPISDVLGVYPKGLDFRDAVWMFKRMLVGLGYVHKKGIVHGSVLPTHILVDPVSHGARILDWSYAVEMSEKNHIKALSRPFREYYAPEIPNKGRPSPATDLYMATKVMVAVLGGNVQTGEIPHTVPEPFRKFLTGCMLPNQAARPNDLWALHDELDGLLRRTVGKPKYRPLTIPPKAKA